MDLNELPYLKKKLAFTFPFCKAMLLTNSNTILSTIYQKCEWIFSKKIFRCNWKHFNELQEKT